MKAWMRDLQIILTSKTLHKRVVFGGNDRVNLTISVSGVKYTASMKDNFTVRISNLTYSELILLIGGQFYDVEIKAGYKSLGGGITIFKGGVLYISNELGDKRTNTAIILCTSKLVAQYGQSKMNLTLKSGINMYAAIKFLCKRAGINDINLANELKYKFAQEDLTVNGNIASILDNLTNTSYLSINSDESAGGVATIWNAVSTDKRVIQVKPDSMIFTGSYPRLNSEGVQITLMPTFDYMPGDILVLDNSLFDISASSRDEVFKNKTMYLDAEGQYMIFEVAYELENRGSNFQVRLLCKAKSLVTNILGGDRNAR